MTEHVDPAKLRIGPEDGRLAPPAEAAAPPSSGQVESHTGPAATGGKRRLWKRLLLAAVALGALGFAVDYGWRYWTVGRFEESTDDAYVRADSTILAPKVAGLLAAVLVGDNQQVKAGQVLAEIDDRDFRAALRQAEANAAAAQATVDSAHATLDQQSAVIEQARATVALDTANLTFAGQDNTRFSDLIARGAGTAQNAQQAKARFDVAQSTLKRDLAVVTAAERHVGLLRAQLAHAEADLLDAAAAVDQARLNLGYTKIASPIDGVVGNRSLRVGQYVQAGTALLSVVPLSSVYVVANFKETQLAHVRQGQPVEIEVDTFPEQTIHGTVDSLAPASGQEFALLPPDNATGNFTKVVQRVPVRIAIEERGPLAGRLRPGMSVVPTITIKDEAAGRGKS